MRWNMWPVALSFGIMVAACGVGAKKEAAHAALTSMPDEERLEAFEATARVLDEKPEFVDEFYAITRRHPATLSRFMANTTRDLHEPELAKMTAELLAKHPESLEQTLVATTDAVVPLKDSRKAMSRAIGSRAPQTVDVLTDDPDALARVLAASLDMIEKKPAARKAALAAVRKNRARMLALVKNDPELSKEIAEELLREVVEDKPALEKALRSLGVIDDDNAKAKQSPPDPKK